MNYRDQVSITFYCKRGLVAGIFASIPSLLWSIWYIRPYSMKVIRELLNITDPALLRTIVRFGILPSILLPLFMFIGFVCGLIYGFIFKLTGNMNKAIMAQVLFLSIISYFGIYILPRTLLPLEIYMASAFTFIIAYILIFMKLKR